MNSRFILVVVCLWFVAFQNDSCTANTLNNKDAEETIRTGAERTEDYFPLLENLRIAVAGNHTSMLGATHLVDTLLRAGFNVVKVFSPEHGFRGDAAAGEWVDSTVDKQTGLPIVSLYGSNRRPAPSHLNDIDLIVFDIQDVGVRFYTYISTMTYIMEEAARQNIPVIILDRPNPLRHYIDGPVLEPAYSSFVGLHPVPVVHGMTIGEYALMVNGEGWLGDGLTCNVTVIPVENYHSGIRYSLPLQPSPNLPNMHSIYLYPSLCFFEGTQISLGRGTDKPFQVYGHPAFDNKGFDYVFTPESVKAAPNPPQLGNRCFGKDLSTIPLDVLDCKGEIQLEYLLEAYYSFADKDSFFNSFFERLAGTSQLRQQLKDGKSEEQIRESWKPGIESYKIIRSQYLLYPD
jgi:uncharacterized protein YbbC (DUF1343 family)